MKFSNQQVVEQQKKLVKIFSLSYFSFHENYVRKGVEEEEMEEEEEEEFSSADESSADGDIDFWYVRAQKDVASFFCK
jgi:hypothetical protein